MKKILFGLTLILSASVISANAQQTAANATKPTTKTASTTTTGTAAQAAGIKFKEAENTHDFGAIPQGTPVSYDFVFTNTGKAPLILNGAAPSCGCTVPEWPKEAIAPGKSGVIKVTYNAANPNTFDRTVSVTSNADPVVLHIKGDVKVPATAAQAPAPATQQATAPKKN
ncbi:MAG: DUF1573 domain-containing protein [Bacteroidota bacterium]